MPTYYSKQRVNQINGILNMDVKEQSIVTGWIEILKILKENGIIKGEKRLIHTKHVLCHPKNRAGFMLNGFNSHANGLKVKKVGANRSELHGAVAMERSPFPEERAKELAANKAVAEGSNGLIPMPDGNEDFMSLGTGHMVAFVRASNAGCRTPFKELQDATGHISKEILCRDPEFKAMIEEGWEFIVLPWQVGATWPQLAEFAQRALNASNSVATDATEWEVAITMVEVCEGMEKPDWALAQGAALAGNPSCMSYGNAIRTIAELYAGGPGTPLLHEQDEFVKTMGEHRCAHHRSIFDSIVSGENMRLLRTNKFSRDFYAQQRLFISKLSCRGYDAARAIDICRRFPFWNKSSILRSSAPRRKRDG